MVTAQGKTLGILDPGYTRMLLCGRQRAEKLSHLFCGDRKDLPGRVVRFGAGGAEVCWSVPIRVTLCRGVTLVMTLDVIDGTLPLLVGLEAAERAGLVICCRQRTIRSDDGELIGRWKEGELMIVDVDHDVRAGASSGSAERVATLVGVCQTPGGSDGSDCNAGGTQKGAAAQPVAAGENSATGTEPGPPESAGQLPPGAIATMMAAIERLSRQVGDLAQQQGHGMGMPASPWDERRKEPNFETEEPVSGGSPGVQKVLPEVQAQESGVNASLHREQQERVDRGVLSEELRVKLNERRTKQGC